MVIVNNDLNTLLSYRETLRLSRQQFHSQAMARMDEEEHFHALMQHNQITQILWSRDLNTGCKRNQHLTQIVARHHLATSRLLDVGNIERMTPGISAAQSTLLVVQMIEHILESWKRENHDTLVLVETINQPTIENYLKTLGGKRIAEIEYRSVLGKPGVRVIWEAIKTSTTRPTGKTKSTASYPMSPPIKIPRKAI